MKMPLLNRVNGPHCLLLLLAWLPSALAWGGAIGPETHWKDPAEVHLEVDFPGDGYHARWQLFRCVCGDLLVRSELNVPGEIVHGDILLVANRAVLTRGYEAEAAELVSLDAPALMLQLALRLLERVEPAGPAAITAPRDVAVEDKINPVNLDSGAVAGGFPAPWQVSGRIEPVAGAEGDSARRFDLLFSFSTGAVAAAAGAEKSALRLSGTADYAAREFPLEDATDLSDWTLSWRDSEDKAAAGSAAISTLAALRERLRTVRP